MSQNAKVQSVREMVEEVVEVQVNVVIKEFAEKKGLPLLYEEYEKKAKKRKEEKEKEKVEDEKEGDYMELVLRGVEELVNIRVSKAMHEHGDSLGVCMKDVMLREVVEKKEIKKKVEKVEKVEKEKEKNEKKLEKEKEKNEKKLEKEKEKNEKKSGKSKSIELPYVGKNEECCHGLRKNGGLYTQCEKKPGSGSSYCNACMKESMKNEDGYPNAGDVCQRESVGYALYKDRKGSCVTAYRKYMSTHNLTREEVEKEALCRGVKIAEIHFEEYVKKAVGRPKGQSNRSGKVVENNESDLFASLLKKSEETKKKEAIVEAEVEVKKVEEEKKVEVEEKKVDEKKKKKAKAEEEEEVEDVVTRIEYEGKKYLRSKKSGVIYDEKTQNVLGQWEKETGKIIWKSKDEEEEEEFEELEDLDEDEDDDDEDDDDEDDE